MAGDYLIKRDGFWHYARRVPLAYSELDCRGIVRQSTKIRVADDPRGAKARRAADLINKEIEVYWRGLTDGQAAESRRRYDAARKRARSLGFDYVQAADLPERGLVEVLSRLAALLEKDRVEVESEVAAVLGGEGPPEMLLSGMFDEFEALERASIADLSEDQKRKWRNPKKRAVSNLISVIGDKALHRVSRDDALEFRQWWQDRVIVEGVEIATANKDIGHLSRMLKTIDRRHRLGIGPIFGDLKIEGGVVGSRRAFTPEFIRDRILKPGALAGLNDEARDVLLVMVETGLRPTEIVNLTESAIHLGGPVPYVQARPEGRRMKTLHSERDMPLVGVALEAMERRPAGFPRYRDSSATLSATINKFLGENGLRPTPLHTLYSLRHTFEDRLTAVEAPDKLIASLMGHKFHRPKYGSGPSLAQKAEWLHRIAFTTAPSTE